MPGLKCVALPNHAAALRRGQPTSGATYQRPAKSNTEPQLLSNRVLGLRR